MKTQPRNPFRSPPKRSQPRSRRTRNPFQSPPKRSQPRPRRTRNPFLWQPKSQPRPQQLLPNRVRSLNRPTNRPNPNLKRMRMMKPRNSLKR
ncbi:MAG: hypothetical protein DRR08_33615 [Candidatus Parabeggiatoa sp. nov. 2]|nr:MAG: hypothetical protein DRR08_33615 [Gammaproteobacteria bacterium]